MSFSTIISTDELEDRLGDPTLVVVDVRSSLADAGYGERMYMDGHIPGALFADLNRDLSDPPGSGRGRHPLPDVATIAAKFGELGISRESRVAVYDDSDGMYASRMWWMLRFVGHDRVAVLDGGYAKWVREARTVTSEQVQPSPAVFVARPRTGMVATAGEVESMRLDPARALFDSRSPDRYWGENETIDPVAGHIPGARNRFFKENVREDGTMKTVGELRDDFLRQLGGVEPDGAVVYCGSGVTACHNLLAMSLAGFEGAKLYAGSWSEWISDEKRPIAVGEE